MSQSRLSLPESNWQVSGAVNVQSSSRLPGFIAGQLDVVKPLEEIVKGDFRFHPGQRRAQAEVDSVAESDVRIRVASNVKFFAALELIFISIGRSDHRQHQVPGQERLAVDLDRARRGAHHPLNGRAIAECFLDGRGNEIHVYSQQRKL